MIRIWRVGIPAFSAAAVLLIAVLVDVWMTTTGRIWYHVDIIFNAILIGIAILGFFFIGLPTKTQNEHRLAGLLSNLLVSMLAFPMNIAVFGHKINWISPLEDLWDGHIGWLCSAILQILLLSGLGEQLLSWVRGLLTLGTRAAIVMREAAIVILEDIKAHDKGVTAIMTVSTVIWTAFLVCKVYHIGTYETLADPNTLMVSILIWSSCVIIGVIIYVAPLILHKARDGVKVWNPQGITIAVIAVIILAALGAAFPSLLKAVYPLVTSLILPLCLVCLIIGGAVWKVRGQPPKGKGTEPTRTINPNDLTIVLLAFCVFPLLVLNVETVLSPQGQEILNRGQVDITSCLDYITACCNVASALIQLYT